MFFKHEETPDVRKVVKLFFSFLFFAELGARGTFKLPARARIVINKPVQRKGFPDLPDGCVNRRLTERELRHEFATYHEVNSLERNEGYQELGCDIDETIMVDGKHFTFTDTVIDLLDTTWPDGKLHTLGRDHSDLYC